MSTLRRISSTALTATLAAATLAATAQPAEAAERRTDRQQDVRQARDVALGQLGDRYGYGAEGPHRFDCSGLTYYAYRRAGYDRIPRTSDAQAHHANRIAKEDLRRGDLMFFHDDGGVYHVAMFAGWRNHRRVMVHSPSTGERVHRSVPWTRSWFAGTMRGV